MLRLSSIVLAASLMVFAAPGFAAGPPPTPTAAAPATGPTPAERQAQLAALCAKVPCRKESRQIEIRADAQHGFRYTNQQLPYVDPDGTIILYPGETITVSLAADGDKLAVPKIVSVSDSTGAVDLGDAANKSAVPETTMTFAFSQIPGKPDMILFATNRTKLMLKYSAIIMTPSEQGLKASRTTICPVLPSNDPKLGFTGTESWQQGIGMLIVTNLHILPSDGSTACN